MCLARGEDDDFDVLSQGDEKVHEAFYGESAGRLRVRAETWGTHRKRCVPPLHRGFRERNLRLRSG